MFGQSLLSGAFGTALVPDENFGINLYTGTGANQTIGGKIKGAASFNGSNSVINILSPIGQASSNENDDFTSSIWVKFDTITSSAGGFNGAIIGNGAGSIYAAFALYTYGHASGLSLAMERYFNNTGYYSSSWSSAAPFTAVINTWYHIATTYVGSTKTVTHYVDGTALPSYTLATNAGSRTMNPNLGLGSYNGSSYGLDGQLDQLRIFNTILTPSQISSLATETAATAGTLNFPAGAGCVAAYQLDTNANTILSQDDLSTVNFPSGTTGAALYQFENSPNGDAGPNPTTTTNLTYVDGAFGKAVDFNGSSSVWQSTNQIIDSQQSFTISMWIKMDAYNGSSQYLWTSYATGDWGISFGQKSPYDRYVSFHKWNSAHGGGLSIDAPDVTTLGQWYHVCGTFSTTTGMVLYINGASVATSTTTWTGINHGAYSDSIGCYGGTWTGSRSNFTGQIDQFRAYQQTLTAAQVLELAKGEPKYNGGSTTANLNGWVNFKPDLTWIKKRTGGTGNNLLQNTVNGTGTGSSLSSNSDTAAGNFDQYGYLSSFNEKGFTTQGGSSGSYPYDNLGESGSGYVSWNWKAGADTYAGYFNGSSSAITSSDQVIPNGACSISFWYNPQGSTGTEYIIGQGVATASKGPTVYWYNQSFGALVAKGTSALAGSANGATTYSTTDWHQVVFTWDGTSNSNAFKVYVNGSLLVAGTSDTSSASIGAYTYLGIGGLQGGSYANGLIDQVRIFNTVLSTSQVTSLYGETSGNNNTLNFPAGAGCVAAYTLDNTANDLSGNYNGTPSNITYVKPGYTGRNNDGTIESQVSANTDYGFSIVNWVASSTASDTIGSGLGKKVEFLVTKSSTPRSWNVWHKDLPNNGYLHLNTTNAEMTPNGDRATVTNNTTFTAEGTSGNSMLAYCWHSVPKYSKIGSYTGGSSGKQVTGLGFQPRFLVIKRTDSAGGWRVQDAKRLGTPPSDKNVLEWNDAAAEAVDYVDLAFDADGFTLNTTNADYNSSGGEYIYMALA